MDFIINPQAFVNEMEAHWMDNLNNTSSNALRQVWETLASTFGFHIDMHGCDSESTKQTWTVLQPECGTGKTQGAIIYCKMLSELPKEEHPGVLIVTRLTDDCDLIAARINKLSGKDDAVSFHSKNDVTIGELPKYPVTVITHRAYELALDSIQNFNQINNAFDLFLDWNEGERKLVIIDEALDVIDEVQLTLDELRDTLGVIPELIRQKCPKEITAMQAAINLIETHKETKDSREFVRDPMQVFQHFSDEGGRIVNFKELKKSLSRINLTKGRNDDKEQQRLKQIHAKRLDSLSKLLKGWIYYANTGRKETLNNARLIVPENIRGAVILDATANQNLTYRLFGVYPQVTRGARSYENVTLHIARGHNTGKRFLTRYDKRKQHVEELISWMLETINKDSKVFVCTHKDLEPLIASYETPFEIITGHWHAIDGSNKWQECDVGIYFGLPWLPDTKPVNTFFSLQGVKGDEWLNGDSRQWEEFEDIRASIKSSNMVVSIIQAFNRLRCRNVIDAKGNCKKTDVYVWLNDNQTFNDALLQAVIQEMPKIKLKDFTYDAIKSGRLKKGKAEQGLIKFAENVSIGKYSSSYLKKALGFSDNQWRKLAARLKDTATELHAVLLEMNVKYQTERNGSRTLAYLVKA